MAHLSNLHNDLTTLIAAKCVRLSKLSRYQQIGAMASSLLSAEHPYILCALILITPPLQTAICGVCTTSGCRSAATMMVNLINSSFDPCQDFYHFTCGDGFSATDEAKVSLDAMVRKEVDDQIILMLIKPVNASEPKAIQGIKKFFKSCVDENAIEKEGHYSIKRALMYLEGWPVIEGSWYEDGFKLEDLLVRLRRIGYRFEQLFDVRMGDDVLMITQPVVEIIDDANRQSYLEYMVQTAVLLGAHEDVATAEFEAALVFRTNLTNILQEEDLEQMTIRKLQRLVPILPWLHFLNRILHSSGKVYEGDMVQVSLGYLKNLQEVLEETRPRTVANSIIWEAIDSIVPYLPKDFRRLKQQYKHSTSSNLLLGDETWSRLAFCKTRARQILRPAFEALYVREYFPSEKKKMVEDIVAAVKEEFLDLLNETDLFDEETKGNVLDKAASIRYSVGAPENLYDEGFLLELFDEEEGIDPNDFLTVASILTRQAVSLGFKFGSRADFHNSFYEEALLPKAFYTTFYNSMVLPAASLQDPFFNEQRPHYFNFGRIGAMLGYEITHGFTLKGSNFNRGAYYVQLWTNASIDSFNQKAECLLEQAYNFTVDNSFQMNARNVLDEVVCDYTGVEVAYRAYRRWAEEHGGEKQLPGLSYTPKQFFWISAASFFCNTIPTDRLRSDRTAYPTFRTFAALSNNARFAEDFNCARGTAMNPQKRCRIF